MRTIQSQKQTFDKLSQKVKRENAHLGITVDPDVDKIAHFCMWRWWNVGEEYTLVAVLDVLQNKRGATVSNLSSTMALKDVTEKAGCTYFPSAVGGVNVSRNEKGRSSDRWRRQ